MFVSQRHVIHTITLFSQFYHPSSPHIRLNDFFWDTSRWRYYFYMTAAVAFEWGRKSCQWLFWEFYVPGQAIQYKPTNVCTECECVWERDWWERKREGGRSLFDPSESEEGIEFLLPLSEVTIPRSGVQFHLCHVEIPSSGLVCLSVFQRRCANLEPSPRRLYIPLDSCVEKSHSASQS